MIFGINLGTHNIGLKCGRAKWQDGRPQEKISVLFFESCGNTNTNVRKLHASTMTTQHATQPHNQQGWRFGLVSPWRLDHQWVPAGHGPYTGAHHDGMAVDGPITTTTHQNSTAH